MKLSGLPRTSPLVTKDSKVQEDWDQYLQSVVAAINATTQQFSTVSDSSLHATVPATAFPTAPNLSSGLYRVTYAMWVTQAATTSSSLTFTAAWTNNGQSFTQSGAALTTNSLTSQQNGQMTFQIDTGTQILYQLTYASVGGTVMKFQYRVNLEAVP